MSSIEEGDFVVKKLSLVAKKFLDLDIKGLGVLSEDPNLIKSIKKQDIMELYKGSTKYVQDIEAITNKILNESTQFEEITYKRKSKIMARLKKAFM